MEREQRTSFSSTSEAEATENAPLEQVVVENSISLGISAGHDAQVDNSLVLGAVVAGNDLTVSDSFGSALVAGNDLRVQDGGGAVVVAGGDVHLTDGAIGILVAGGNAHLDGNSKILMTSQQALILGIAAGGVLALSQLLLRRK
ncbi:MAG: hypothetical protein ACOYYS_19070 [Chloroflexota bacterium]